MQRHLAKKTPASWRSGFGPRHLCHSLANFWLGIGMPLFAELAVR